MSAASCPAEADAITTGKEKDEVLIRLYIRLWIMQKNISAIAATPATTPVAMNPFEIESLGGDDL